MKDENEDLMSEVKFWNTELIGIVEGSKEKDKSFLKYVKYDESQCVKQLEQVHSPLGIKADLLKVYDQVIHHQFNIGMIEQVSDQAELEGIICRIMEWLAEKRVQQRCVLYLTARRNIAMNPYPLINALER